MVAPGCVVMAPGHMSAGPVHPERLEGGQAELHGQFIAGGSRLQPMDIQYGTIGGVVRGSFGLGRSAELETGLQAAWAGPALLTTRLRLRGTARNVTLGAGVHGGTLIDVNTGKGFPMSFGWIGPDLLVAPSTATGFGFFSLANQLGLSIPWSTRDTEPRMYTAVSYSIEPGFGFEIGPGGYITVTPIAGFVVDVEERTMVYGGIEFGVLVRPAAE